METLPNIDINIKCGNSLVHKLPVEVGKKLSEKNDKDLKAAIMEYRQWVNKYKKENDKVSKQEIKSAISKVKRQLHQVGVQTSMDFMGDTTDFAELELMKNAFEWAIEFPEVLSDDGTFLGFDCVIGNPPYGVKFNKEEKTYLMKNFPNVPDYESADFFIDEASIMLKNNGLLAYIVPNMFLSNQFAKKFRNSLLDFKFLKIDNLSNWSVFDTAVVRNAIIIFSKNFNKKHRFLTLELVNNNLIKTKDVDIDTQALKDSIDNWMNIFVVDETTLRIIEKMKSNTIQFDKLCNVSQGLIPYDKYRGHSEEIIKNRIYNAKFKKDETYKKELQGKDVCRYKVVWNGEDWLSYGNWLAAPRRKEFFTKERILIREITNPRIFATITDEEYYNTPSIINCIEFKESPFYLLGLINSKLFTFYHITSSPKVNKGLFPKILISDVQKLPIKLANEHIQEIEKKVKILLNNYDPSIDQEIDTLVYKVYNLTSEEIAIVESSVK